MKNLISVITTVKNGENFIVETLDSVRKQSFRNFEHIVVNDGSIDNTANTIKEYQRNFPDYNLKFFDSNGLGRGKALNYAVSKADSDWIAIIDADDIWHPKKLEIQYSIINEGGIDVLATGSKLFNNKEDIVYSDNLKDGKIVYYKSSDLLRSNKLSHSSVLIRKVLCIYDENRRSQFDYELWLRLAEQRKVLAKATTILNYHRIHDNQSFEGKMKKAYRWRSFKLKASKCIENKDIKSLVYNLLKLVFDLLFPRNVRFKIKNLIKNN